jgi:hypothetical protein
MMMMMMMLMRMVMVTPLQVLVGDDWTAGLELSFEIRDARDGFLLLSASGPFSVEARDEYVDLRLTGSDRKEVVGPAFSAQGRDSRFNSIEEYFLQVMMMMMMILIYLNSKECGTLPRGVRGGGDDNV